ncbi:MAG TPA: hypothetical protein VKW08_26885 [Xanthobacteraceae bacterium]|jgi:hypothetical protein|nr:hypothetical protein [Xanthobacteraceae bacterium]
MVAKYDLASKQPTMARMRANRVDELRPLSSPELAARIRDALKDVHRNRSEWITNTQTLAAALVAARHRLPDDQGFGDWLEQEHIVIGKTDRAALINIGRNLDMAAEVLAITDTWSWRRVWEEIQVSPPGKPSDTAPTAEARADIVQSPRARPKKLQKERFGGLSPNKRLLEAAVTVAALAKHFTVGPTQNPAKLIDALEAAIAALTELIGRLRAGVEPAARQTIN